MRLMSRHKADEVRGYGTQKVIGEEMIAEFKADSDLDIRNQILSLRQHFDSYPVLIKLNNTTLNRTFIADHLIDINDTKATYERVFCVVPEIAKKVRASMDEKIERHHRDFLATLQEHGYSGNLFIDAITGGKATPINGYLTDEEIEENLSEKHPRERAVLLEILNDYRGWAPRVYAEIASEFGIPIESFRTDDRLNPIYLPYVIGSKAQQRDSQPLDTNTVTHLFLEERGRLIGTVRAYMRVDVESWLARFHPEMTSKDTSSFDNW